MVTLIQSTLTYMIPLMIVALAGVFAERSGIINIALDGMMIIGAFVGALFVYILQDKQFGIHLIIANGQGQWVFLIAMLLAAIAGAVFSLLLSFSAIKLKADQTIGGTALNMLAPAISLFLINMIASRPYLAADLPPWLGEGPSPYQSGTTSWFIIQNEHLKGTVLEPFFSKMYISTYITIILFVVLSVVLYKTSFGLRLRACGEHPQAADSVGINVNRMRYVGTLISGALGGFGGFLYVVYSANGAAGGDVQGAGFLALAIMIFGNWKPKGIALGSLLFGLLKCISVLYNQLDINGDGVALLANIGLPSYFYNILPFLAVLIVLAFTGKKSRAPKAEGIPYDKGMR